MKFKDILSTTKSEKGVTLLGLIIYVTTFICITGVIGVISNFFYSNTKILNDTTTDAAQFTKLQLFIANEFQTKKSTVTESTLFDGVEDLYETINFSSWNRLIYHQGYVFYNKIKICENVQELKTKIERVNGRDIFKIYIVFGNMAYTTDFAMPI